MIDCVCDVSPDLEFSGCGGILGSSMCVWPEQKWLSLKKEKQKLRKAREVKLKASSGWLRGGNY